MQIKKTTRDAAFQGVPRFATPPYGEPDTESSEEAPLEAFSARTTRPHAATPERPAPTENGERSQPAPRSVSVIDRHSSFDGQFETEHDLRIEGTISGEVICRGLMTIEREATVRARVQARDAHIQGRLEGDIVCAGKLLLAATSHITGTMKAAVLEVEEGATVSGTVDTTQAPGAVAKSSPAMQENGNGHEPATVTRTQRRDLPSFAIVASDDRSATQN